MLNLQDQSERPKTVLRGPCAVSHEETLHVSTTACVEQNISTQESMLHRNSVQETETAIATLVETHQTDSAAAAGPASTILSTMSSMKLRDIMDKMTSCLFGWSWRQVSQFDLTGKNTETDKPTVCIPCTDIVPVTVQELFFPCSWMEDTMSCNQEVEESVAIPPPPQPSLAEVELCLRLAGIYDITACLTVVFRPECIVQVDCSVEIFEAIADRMGEIGLPLPTRSPASTLAIMPPQPSTVQEAIALEEQTVECDNHEMVVNQLEDTPGYNQVQLMESMVVHSQPRTAELELRLQLQGVCDITGSLRVVFRPECIVQVDCSMVNFEAIAEHMRVIGLQLPTRSTDNTLAIMPPQPPTSIVALEDQHVNCDNYEMAVVVSQGALQLENHEAVEHPSLLPLPAVEEAETLDIDEICSLLASMSGHTTKQPSMVSTSKVLKGSEIFFGRGVVALARGEENHVQDLGQENTASSPNEPQVMETLVVQPEPNTGELELRLQLQGVCDITGRLRVIFRPECIVLVDLSILRCEALGDDIREIDLQLPMDAITSALGLMSPHSMTLQEAVISEVHPAEHSNIPALPATEKAESVDIDEVCSLLEAMTGHDLSKPNTSKDVAISKGSEIFFGKVIRQEEENDIQDQRDTSSSNNEVQVLEPLVVQPEPRVTELEVRLHLQGVCDITGRLRVVFRPECIVLVDLSILRFDALGDDIREIDLQLPMDAITSALGLMSPHSMTLQEALTSEVHPAEHSSFPALPAVGEAETVDNDEVCLLLASVSCHAEVPSNDVPDLKGYEIFFGKTVPSEEESKVMVPTEPAEETKHLDNANDLQNAVCKETTDLQLEPMNAVPVLPTEGIELQHVIILRLPELSVEEKATAEQTVSEITVSSPSAQEVQAAGSANAMCQAIQTEDAHPTNATLEEVVAREIREIRETVDNTVGGIHHVSLERTTARRKRRHADDSHDNQLLSQDSEVEKSVANDLLDEMQESPLVTNGTQRYPSDVHQAILTQTVHLLERGIVLLSDDGSFIAVANPSSASRIGDALTEHKFAKIFQRYDNDVLPQDLKQKVIERAVLVAREHEDKVSEGMVERPIFTLSEIRNYDCNGDYIMEDVSSPKTPVYPFTGIQPTPVHQGFVNPFLTGMTPQGLLTAGIHNPFQVLQHYQYSVNDIEMIDVDELYMDVDESIDDMFMECDDQEDCPYCSQISLSLFASLPTKYAIRRRAIYSLLDERPLNPEIPSWRLNQGAKKSWFAYNTFSFRPEFDQPLGGLSPKDRVIYSLLDERPLNPPLPPSLARQNKSKTWFAYNTFSFREGDLVPVWSSCDCMQTTTSQPGNAFPCAFSPVLEPLSKRGHVGNPVFPSTTEENVATSKSPFNIFSFRPEEHSSQQASFFGESKQESVFSFGKAEQSVLSTEPETISSGISSKDFSFPEEDDPLFQAEADKSEAEKQSLNKETLAFSGEQEEEPTFPVSTDCDETSTTESETESQDDDLFDLNDENEEQTIKHTNKETLSFSGEQEEVPTFPVSEDSDTASSVAESHDDDLFDLNDENEEQTIKHTNKETLSFSGEQEEEPTFPVSEDSDTASSVAESHDDDLFDLIDENEEQTIKEIIAAVKSKLDESRMYHRPQEVIAQVSSSENDCAASGESVKVDETANKKEPFNKQDVVDGQTNLEAKDEVDETLMDGAIRSQETNQVSKDPPQAAKCSSLESREPARKLTISHSKSINKRSEPYPTQAVSGLAAFMRRRVKMVERDRLKTLQVSTQVTLEDADSSEPVPALPADNAQQQKLVSLKSLIGKTQTKSSSKPDLAITIGASDEERKVMSSRTLAQDKKADLPTAPSVQSDVNNSNKKISLKPLTQTKKKEADGKGSEVDRLKSRHQSKDADVLSKPTPATSTGSDTVDNIKRVSFALCEKTERDTSTPPSVPSDGEKRGKVISLRSVVQSKKPDPIIKSSSSESQAEIKGASWKLLDQTKKEKQISKPPAKEGSSQPAPLKPMADSMSNPIPCLPLVSSDAEHNEVVSLNPLSKDNNTEAPNKTARPAPSASPGVQETKVVSLKSLTQNASKKDEQENKSVASVLQVASGVKESKESCDLVKYDTDLSRPSTQCRKMGSSKEPEKCAAQMLERSTKEVSVNLVEQPKTVDVLKQSIPSKPLPAVKVEESRIVSLKSLTQESKSKPINKAPVASPPASILAESRTKKTTDNKRKESGSNTFSSSKIKVSDAKNVQLVAMDKVLVASDVTETGSTRKVTFELNQERPKEDAFITLSPSPSLEQEPKMVSSKESHATTVAEHSSAKTVDIKTKSVKKDGVIKSSTEHHPCEQNTKVISLKKESHATTVAEHSSAKTADIKTKSMKKDGVIKSSTEPPPCEQNTKVISLKKESHATSVSEHSSAKTVDIKTKSVKKDGVIKSSTEPLCEQNTKVISLKKESHATSVAEHRSAKTADNKTKSMKKDGVIKSSTEPPFCEQNTKVISLKRESHATNVSEHSSAKTVDIKTKSVKKDGLIKSSTEPPCGQNTKVISLKKESHATNVSEHSSAKTADIKTKSAKKDGLIKSSTEPPPCGQNTKGISLKKESHATPVAEHSSAKTVDIKTKSAKKDGVIKSSTEPPPCEQNTKGISLKKESHATPVAEHSSAKDDLRSKSTKKDELKTPSTKPASCDNNTEVSSLKKESRASTSSEPSIAKAVDFTFKLPKKDELRRTSTEPTSCEENTSKVVSIKKASNASSGPENSSAKQVTLGSVASRKKDLTKPSPQSTKPVSCKRDSNVVPLQSASLTSSVQANGSAKDVGLTAPQKEDLNESSPSTKPVSYKRDSDVVPSKSVSRSEDGPLTKPSSSNSPSSREEQEKQLMSFKSVTKREWAVPSRKSSGPFKVNISVPLLEACAVTPTADVKIDGSAKEDNQPHPVVSQPSSSEKRKTFQSLTSSHKRELDEMLEEDQQSDKERLRNFTSSAGQKSSRKTTRKVNVQPKSEGHSTDSDRKKTSDTDKDVKLVKTDVVQDTSVAKGSPATKKELQPISLTVDVTVKDAKNESTPKWVPGTLKETKPSPERKVAVADVPKSNTTQPSQGTSEQSSLASLAAANTGVVNASGGSAVQSSPAIPNPRPLLPAEAAGVMISNTVDTVNVLRSSPSIVPTTTEPSSRNDTETISKDASNMAGSVKTMVTSDTPCLLEPQQSAPMDLVKEPLCLAGVVALSGENQANPKEIPKPVPRPAAENVTTAGKRKLEDMQQEEDEKIPSLDKEKPVEVRKKRRWRTEEKPPEKQEEQPNKPRRRIVRNMFKKG